MAFASSQHPEINPCTPQPWFDFADTLGKEKSLDPIDVGSPFLDEPIPLNDLGGMVKGLFGKD